VWTTARRLIHGSHKTIVELWRSIERALEEEEASEQLVSASVDVTVIRS
jgi:hypothetical protein